MSQHYYADGATHNDHHKEINIGSVTSNDLKDIVKGFFKDDDVEDANVIEENTIPSTGAGPALDSNQPATTEKPLCVVLNSKQRQILEAAEQNSIIVYNPTRKGYDKGQQSSNVLVAYLCGRIFCGDYSEDDVWKGGKRFDEAKYCEKLFGFDVAATRRKTRNSGAGKPPMGYERVDNLFEK